MNKINGWTRQAHVTRGADPTEVVTWIHDNGTTITEFQNVYRLDIPGAPDELYDFLPFSASNLIATSLHQSLEALYAQEQEREEAYLLQFLTSFARAEGEEFYSGGTPREELNLVETIDQLVQLKQLMEFHKRDPQTMMVYARGKRISTIEPLDDGSGQDNLDIYLS